MTDPVRWLSPGSNPPEGARELLRELSPPPRMESMVRARVGMRINEHAETREPARIGPASWLPAAFAGAACAIAAAFLVGPFRADDPAPIATPPPAQKASAAPALSAPPPDPERGGPVQVEETVEEQESVEEQETVEETAEERAEERVEPRTVRRQRRERRTQPRRERVVRRAPAPEVATEVGTLSIDTSPRSRVFIDGEDIGMTPIVRRRIPAGLHDIRFQGGNGAALHVRVMVRPDQETRIVHQLGRGGGSIDLRMR